MHAFMHTIMLTIPYKCLSGVDIDGAFFVGRKKFFFVIFFFDKPVVCAYMHVRSMPRCPHEDPIGMCGLCRFREEVGSLIMLPEDMTRLCITITPVHTKKILYGHKTRN